jgi:hypothetical protein
MNKIHLATYRAFRLPSGLSESFPAILRVGNLGKTVRTIGGDNRENLQMFKTIHKILSDV